MILDQALAILNGTIGDYLDKTKNGLATDMGFFEDGARLRLDRPTLEAHLGTASRVVVFVHGIMSTESIWRFADGTDYGENLERDFGFASLYLRYNTGRPIRDNGEALACLLDSFAENAPNTVKEIVLVGYSMGGLVVRSACAFATVNQLGWLARIRRILYVGTPHGGAPAERVGRVVASVLGRIPDPYTRTLSEVGNFRSQGIKDLGDGDVSALLPGVEHCLIAGHVSDWFGDNVVPVDSATYGLRGVVAGPSAPRVRILPRLSHVDLAHHADVYKEIRDFLEQTS